MTNRPEPSTRFVELAENRRAREGAYAPAPEPSLPAALEKLTSATQGVITKRFDLFMLEINELVGKVVVRSALVMFGVVTALAAWFGGISALILYLTPNSGTVLHLGIFGLVNLAIAAAVVAFAVREQLPKLSTESAIEHEEAEQSTADRA